MIMLYTVIMYYMFIYVFEIIQILTINFTNNFKFKIVKIVLLNAKLYVQYIGH